MIFLIIHKPPLNQMIIDEFKSYINPEKTLVIDNLLLKNRIRDIRWDNKEYMEVEEREGKNPDQIAKVRKMRDITLKSLYSKGNLNKAVLSCPTPLFNTVLLFTIRSSVVVVIATVTLLSIAVSPIS